MPSPTSSIPNSIPEMLAATAQRYGDRLAVADGDTQRTWAELHDEAGSFGAALVASGVEPGDRVALWAPNSARWVVAVLGLLRAGAVLVPVNTRFKGPEAADILGRGGVRVLLTVTDFLGTDHLALLAAAGADLPELRTTVVVDGPVPAGAVDGTPSSGRRRTPGARRWNAAARTSAPRPPRTSCSRRGRPGCPRAWS